MDFLEAGGRSHLCAAPTEADVGATVALCGWVHHRRDHGGCVFIDLRDHSGVMQVVFDAAADAAVHGQAAELRGEWVVGVRGPVRGRSGNANPSLPTGTIEVAAEALVVFARASTPPFPVAEEVEAGEEVRLRHRAVDLRRPTLQRNLRLRHTVAQAIRADLSRQGFVEVETPMLVRSTPEGARDYVVPSRLQPGAFFALPQSPQLFKQLLMVGGMDRYFQVARCFRDEDLRAERQPEFSQIDLEMAFVSPAAVQEVVESLLAAAWAAGLGIALPRPFKRLTYQAAMQRFGVDAPDTRFGLELCDLTGTLSGTGFQVFARALADGGAIGGINLRGSGEWTRRELDALTEEASVWGAKGIAWARVGGDGAWTSPIAKFLTDRERGAIAAAMGLAPGDVAIFSADRASVVHAALGNLRRAIGRRRGLAAPGRLDFVWVTDFPLLEREPGGQLTALHHPFTAPLPADRPQLATAPERVRAQAYDIVLNGVELGGGSIRNHTPAAQAEVFAAMGIGPERQRAQFGFLLDALGQGAPPHGGAALGLDRIIMAMAQTPSIRDVIAFPKTQRQIDLMTDAPSPLSAEQLAELGLMVRGGRGPVP